jgi:chromate transporter
VTTISVAGPSSVLTYLVGHIWYRFRDARWRRRLQAGLVPVTVGLLMASAALLIRTTSAEWGTAAVTIVATALFLLTRIHPLLVLAVSAALGAVGLLG